MANPFFETPQNRRLKRDFEEMKAVLKVSSILSFETSGNPPNTYKIRFDGKRLSEGGMVTDEGHEVEVRLGSGYPQSLPAIKWKTPIMHPNISGGQPCFGTFIMNPRVKLVEIVEILWDMARMSTYNPYGGYGGLGQWQVLNKKIGFPIDSRILADKAPQVDREEKPDEGEPDIIIMGGSAGPGPSQQWVKKAVGQFFEQRNLGERVKVYTADEWAETGQPRWPEAVGTLVLDQDLYEFMESGSDEANAMMEQLFLVFRKLGVETGAGMGNVFPLLRFESWRYAP